MYHILFNRPYALLFSAQIVALLGTGLLTVALGFLSHSGVLAALRLWPVRAEQENPHAHPDLPPEHPRRKEYDPKGNRHRRVL